MILSKSIEIDSLKLRIPISEVSQLRADIISNRSIEVAEQTGEILGAKNKGHRIRISDSATVHVDIQQIRTTTMGTTQCLVILLNSKILEEQYFEGITGDNLQVVYDKLQASKLFSFTWNTFINAECTDIDLKFDELLNEAERINTVKTLNGMVLTKRTDSVRTFTKPTKRNNNSIGIQFNRRSQSTVSKPFLKFYSKGAESKVKDSQSTIKDEAPFFDEYFNYQELENIFRLETTIKDKKHATAFNVKSLRLGDIVHWSESLKVSIFRTMLSKYLMGFVLNNDVKPKNKKLAPSDVVHFKALAYLIETTGTTVENIISSLISGLDPVAKSRMKTKLMNIYSENIEGTKFDVEDLTKATGNYLSKFGIA